MPEKTLAQIRISTDCQLCQEKCCSQPYDWVFLTDREIERIQNRTALHVEDFVTEQENPVNGYRFKVLMLPCRFLNRESGRCGIYEFRPLVCRLFPFYPEPLTGTAELITSQCGEHLKIAPIDGKIGWALTDHEFDIRIWLRDLWKEAEPKKI